jgi:hypothetical protein
MTRTALIAAFAVAVAGCSRQEPADEPPPPPAAVVVAPAEPDPPRPAPPPQAPKAPPAFEYPDDLGGRAVAKAVAPDTPAVPPVERFGEAPRPHALPARVSDPPADAPARYVPPPLVPGKPAPVTLARPPERVPADLGGPAAVPAPPALPVKPGVTERSRDVNLPPPLPVLGRQYIERVSLDDPTAEAGHAAITEPPVKVPVAPAPFVRVAVPNPFELGEQIRPNVPRASEPGLSPVVVDPRRVK